MKLTIKQLVAYSVMLLILTSSLVAGDIDKGNISGELRLPHAFSDHMVLQRDKPARVWGLAKPGKVVTVAFDGQKKSVKTGKDGKWSLNLKPLSANAVGQELIVRSGSNKLTMKDVLVGDIWILGGQSNMEADIKNIHDGDLEMMSADHPAIRLMTVPLTTHTKPQNDFARINEYNTWTKITERKGEWAVCTPKSIPLFSAVGYVFGRRLHMATGVPIGLVDTSWGGTTVEAWISRKTLATIPEAKPLLASWDERINEYDPEKSLAEAIKRWQGRAKKFRDMGRPIPAKPTQPNPNPAMDRNNPAASYNAIVAPLAKMSVKGAIFYQGINNTVGGAKPKLYEKMFTELVSEWRRLFDDPKLPFGICQMVSWGFPSNIDTTEQDMLSSAPYIRESQLKAHLAHPKTGFVVAYDLGHIQMHSPFKAQLGERIARWALASQYGKDINYKTPIYKSMSKQDSDIVVKFDTSIHPKHGGRAKILGFVIAGKDRHFYPAFAKMTADNEVTVSSEFVKNPVAVRYAWATHPLGTLVGGGSSCIPAAPFRTDNWTWLDAPFTNRGSAGDKEYGTWNRANRTNATAWAKERREKEARAVLEKK